jgi:hypothetical protein
MNAILPRTRLLGPLGLVEVYEYYDGPRLFACRSAAGQLYLAVWIDEDEATETWLYAALSPQRLEQIRGGAIDLHDAFRYAENGSVYRVVVPGTPGISQVDAIECSALAADMLPLPGERLDAPPLPIAPRRSTRAQFPRYTVEARR